MDEGIITASTGLIGALVTLLTAIGGALAFFIRRADKKRELGEATLLEHIKTQLVNALAELRWTRDVADLRYADGNRWREQLLRADLDPKPEDWTPLPPKPEPKDKS